MNRWPYIKAVFAHLTDWSFQTNRQAMYKQTDRRLLTQHVAIMAGSHTVAALTSDGVPNSRRALYILINAITHYAITHYAIDSVKLPKWLDQALHLVIALASAKLLEVRR